MSKRISDKTKSCIVMVGAFPPPIHGMAVVNKCVLDHLRRLRIRPLVMNLSSKNLNPRFMLRLKRLFKVFHALVHFSKLPEFRGRTLYMSVSGGIGKIYETIFVLLARIKKMRIFLHHHSFAYLNKRDVYTQILINIAGSSTLHIVLSAKMAKRFQEIYMVPNTVSVSNAVVCFRNNMPIRKPYERPRIIGFIGNISIEKGVLIFLDLITKIEAERLPLKSILAGPFIDASIERKVKIRLSKMNTVEYVGPKFGADKDDFFNNIDVFVFPTRYANEAEPLTILEAMGHGVPIITYGRGCIPEIVTKDCGKVIDSSRDFTPAALTQIKNWLHHPRSFEAASHAATRRFSELYIENQQRWPGLLRLLIGGNHNESANRAELKPLLDHQRFDMAN